MRGTLFFCFLICVFVFLGCFSRRILKTFCGVYGAPVPFCGEALRKIISEELCAGVRCDGDHRIAEHGEFLAVPRSAPFCIL